MADSILGFVFLLFFVVLLAAGVLCVVSPSSILRIRSRWGAGESSWFGGPFFSTPWRTRGTGSVFLVIAALGLAHLGS